MERMEPVPETERMEAFKPSPVPSLLLSSNPNSIPPLDLDIIRKPPTIRRSTDPSPTSPISPSWGPPPSAALPYRPRTASPLSGGHSRSRSAASLASPMSRTQSMPGVSGSGRILYSPQLRPASPSNSGSPSRVRTPRKPADEAFPAISPIRTSVLEHDKKQPDRSSSPVFGPPMVSSSRLRRSSSPFRSVPPPSSSAVSLLPSTPSSSSSSLRGYDALSMSYGGSLSSIPSTPTSARSRSPSISSLETIPDSPDAEEAALEADRLAQLKAAADAADAADGSDSSDSKGRTSMDAPPRGRTLSYGPRDKRKRWSVCGAERRGDLDLETIWED